MLMLLDKIVQGTAVLEDLDRLEAVARTVGAASLCGLGKASPNPVLSTLRYFREEYLEHVVNHKCRAGECTALVKFTVLPEKCIGCGACKRACPVHCISGARKEPHQIVQKNCIKCGTCMSVCKFSAIEKT
jgi:ferredoxin